MKKFTHPKGDGIGGKAAGIDTLTTFHRKGVFAEILVGMSAQSKFRSAGQAINPVVPDTAVLTSGHFKSYTRKDAVRDAIESGDSDQIADAIARTPITDEVTIDAVTRLLSTFGGPLAIRSSASCEDRSKRSPFAGDFDTTFILSDISIPITDRVNALLEAVRMVYSSFFKSTVRKKMHSLGIHPEDHSMPVLIQKVVGQTHQLEINGAIHNAHLPFCSIVLTSRSIGINRPEGVKRDAPFMRIGFGMGTLVVGSDDVDCVPCTIIFPDKPGIIRTPTSITYSEGRGDFAARQTTDFLSSQDRFDAMDLGSGKLQRFLFSDIKNCGFFTDNRLAFSILTQTEILNGISLINFDPGVKENKIRAPFTGFINNPHGKLLIEFFGRLARKMKELCGFDIDMELAVVRRGSISDSVYDVGLLQLRPFGGGVGSINLTDVPDDLVIAKTNDCIGHGRHEFDSILLVTGDAVGDMASAQNVIGKVDRAIGGKYLLIGPNVTADIGKGGVYGEVHNPGAVVSYTVGGMSMFAPGTHTFNNVAMMSMIDVPKDKVHHLKDLLTKARKLSEGVFMIDHKVVVELDGESGSAQAFFEVD
ncbi:MAG: PEP/pyruvate-binding domain-containing protein [Candidatus Micrarchaeota archaeon]